jgi:hypothetical protein
MLHLAHYVQETLMLAWPGKGTLYAGFSTPPYMLLRRGSMDDTAGLGERMG